MHPTVGTTVQNIRSIRARAVLTYLALAIVTDRPADHDVRPSNATLGYAIPAWNVGHWRVSKLLLSPTATRHNILCAPLPASSCENGM